MTTTTASRRLLDHPAAGVTLAGLFALTVFGLALRYHTIWDYDVETDYLLSYVPQARQILQGTIALDDYRGPFYPILLAACSLCSVDFFLAGLALSTLAAFLSLLAILSLFKRLFPAPAAFLGTALVAINPVFVHYSYAAGTDMVFLALALSATFLLLTRGGRGWPWACLAGVLTGAAYLTRYNGLFLPLAAPFVLLFINPHRVSWRERGITLAFFLGAFFLTIAPYGLLCLERTGNFFFSNNYRNVSHMLFMSGGMSWDEAWNVEVPKYPSLRALISAHPRLFFSTVANNIWRHALADLAKLVGPRVSLFALAGLPVVLVNRPSRLLAAYVAFGAALFGLMLPVVHFPRYALYLLPMYTALALYALTWDRLQQIALWRRLRVSTAIGFVLLAWSATRSVQYNRIHMTAGQSEVLVIAERFKNSHIPRSPGAIIVARKPHIAYFLDMQFSVIPYIKTTEELLAGMRAAGASFLFFSRVEVADRPELAGLLDPANAPPELVPLLRTEDPPAVLYGFRAAAP